MKYFNPPQCPHCSGYPFNSEAEFIDAQVEFANDESVPIAVECTECGEQFDVVTSDVMGDVQM